MSSKRERILAHITNALGPLAVAMASPLPVQRSRADQYDRSEAPAVMVSWETDELRQVVHQFVESDLIVMVGIYVRGDVPDQLADPAVVTAHQYVMADQTQGGLAIDTEHIGTQFNLSPADQTAGTIISRYRVWYRHKREDLTL